MDYLFGIVVLLCGAVQPGRGAEPKHNVPRLKLSYKGKPTLQSLGQQWLLVLVWSFSLACRHFHAPVSIHSFNAKYLFFLFYFCGSISATVPFLFTLLHLGQ